MNVPRLYWRDREDILSDAIGLQRDFDNIERERFSEQRTADRVNALRDFLDAKVVTLDTIVSYVGRLSGDQLRSRNQPAMHVMVGGRVCPAPGTSIVTQLRDILRVTPRTLSSIYYEHIKYEMLHPFTDGNGRSGRALACWRLSRSPECHDTLRTIVNEGWLYAWYMWTMRVAGSRPERKQ